MSDRIGSQGEGESDKDYCLRMLRQHEKLSAAVLERLLYGLNPEEKSPEEVTGNALALTNGLAYDDPATLARFAKAWRDCLSDAGCRA